jgi:hypothetical protein
MACTDGAAEQFIALVSPGHVNGLYSTGHGPRRVHPGGNVAGRPLQSRRLSRFEAIDEVQS